MYTQLSLDALGPPERTIRLIPGPDGWMRFVDEYGTLLLHTHDSDTKPGQIEILPWSATIAARIHTALQNPEAWIQ